MVTHLLGAALMLWVFRIFLPIWPTLSLASLILFPLLLILAAFKKEARLGIWGGACLIFFVWTCLIPYGHLRSRNQGLVTACKSNLKNLGTAAELYSVDFEGNFPAGPDLLTPNYLRTLPTCPAARDSMSVARVVVLSTAPAPYGSQLSPGSYLFYCPGGTHRPAGLEENYPQYSSHEGLLEAPK